jgi:YggT family protein
MNSAIDILVSTVGQVLSLLIIADALLSFVLPPFHAVREAIGRVLNPIYAPIRKIIPTAGMFDFTPIVALILIQVLVMILTSIF